MLCGFDPHGTIRRIEVEGASVVLAGIVRQDRDSIGSRSVSLTAATFRCPILERELSDTVANILAPPAILARRRDLLAPAATMRWISIGIAVSAYRAGWLLSRLRALEGSMIWDNPATRVKLSYRQIPTQDPNAYVTSTSGALATLRSEIPTVIIIILPPAPASP